MDVDFETTLDAKFFAEQLFTDNHEYAAPFDPIMAATKLDVEVKSYDLPYDIYGAISKSGGETVMLLNSNETDSAVQIFSCAYLFGYLLREFANTNEFTYIYRTTGGLSRYYNKEQWSQMFAVYLLAPEIALEDIYGEQLESEDIEKLAEKFGLPDYALQFRIQQNKKLLQQV